MTILSLFNNLIFKNNSIEIENKILNHANELENQKIFKLFNEFILEKRNLLEKFKLNEYDKSEVFIRAASNLI